MVEVQRESIKRHSLQDNKTICPPNVMKMRRKDSQWEMEGEKSVTAET
jgi:hypothetical protein